MLLACLERLLRALFEVLGLCFTFGLARDCIDTAKV
jgi:hypothetical protein